VQAAGYELVPLRHAVGPGGLLGTCSQGLLLVAFPVNTRQLIHWNADTALSEALNQAPSDLQDRLGSWQPVSAAIPVTAGQVRRPSSGQSEVRWQDFRGTRRPHLSPTSELFQNAG
jgi:hypothetical protein